MGEKNEGDNAFEVRSQSVAPASLRSGQSKYSSLSKQELQKYFKEKHGKIEEDLKSRISSIASGKFNGLKLKQSKIYDDL
jgi:hypothetical protein